MRTEQDYQWSAWAVMVCFFLIALISLFISLARVQAQTVDPTKIAWDYPALDHVQLTNYNFGFWLEGATDPVQTVDIPTAQCTPIAGGYETAMPRPVLGRYVARLRACNASTCSDWSNVTDPFLLRPRPPVNLRPRP